MLADEFGPAKVIHLHDASIGLKAVRVIDNVALGPAIGGLRIGTDVTAAEIAAIQARVDAYWQGIE